MSASPHPSHRLVRFTESPDAVLQLTLEVCHHTDRTVSLRLRRVTRGAATILSSTGPMADGISSGLLDDILARLALHLFDGIDMAERGLLDVGGRQMTLGEAPPVPGQ